MVTPGFEPGSYPVAGYALTTELYDHCSLEAWADTNTPDSDHQKRKNSHHWTTRNKLKKEGTINMKDTNPKIILLENVSKAKPSSGGTAFMLNKDKMKNRKWNHEILIKGRAQWINLEWNEQTEMSIINV